MTIPGLALRSLRNRRVTAMLTMLAIAVSVVLVLGVERMREGARESFGSTVSGTDLLVGARTSGVQLLLYTVFRMGSPVNNISWESYQRFASHPEVAWSIPLSLGDSHRGFRVLGTTAAYFEHYRYGRDRALAFAEGGPFADVFDTVLGADVARELGYEVGRDIVIAHGIGETALREHTDKPFRVVGVLAPTGTPVDRTVHVSLEGMEAIHVDWRDGVPPRPEEALAPEDVRGMALTPSTITGFLLGLKSRLGIFRLQREINQYPAESLTAVLPGVALQELWSTVRVAENALRLVSGFVVLTGLMGMLTAMLTMLDERRREMAILRSVGARPAHVFGLLASEAAILTALGAALGAAALYVLLGLAEPWLATRYGLVVAFGGISAYDAAIVGGVIAAGLVVGCVPAWRAYRYSLVDGLTMRL